MTHRSNYTRGAGNPIRNILLNSPHSTSIEGTFNCSLCGNPLSTSEQGVRSHIRMHIRKHELSQEEYLPTVLKIM